MSLSYHYYSLYVYIRARLTFIPFFFSFNFNVVFFLFQAGPFFESPRPVHRRVAFRRQLLSAMVNIYVYCMGPQGRFTASLLRVFPWLVSPRGSSLYTLPPPSVAQFPLRLYQHQQFSFSFVVPGLASRTIESYFRQNWAWLWEKGIFCCIFQHLVPSYQILLFILFNLNIMRLSEYLSH